jgi:hypothetical protein
MRRHDKSQVDLNEWSERDLSAFARLVLAGYSVDAAVLIIERTREEYG